MPPWLRPLLSGMLGMTALTLLVLALLPALARRYRQRTLYGLLIICLLGFLIPWRPLITPRPAVTVTLPDEAARRLRPNPRAPELMTAAPDGEWARAASLQTQPETPVSAPVHLQLIFALIWAAGAACVLGRELLRYFRFTRLLKRWREAPDAADRTLLTQEARTVGLRRTPMLWRAPCVAGPLVTGLACPAVYLPDSVGETDLRLVLRHELTHLRQGDLPVKWLTLAVCAIHWFNPAVWLLRRALNQACELSCDERVMAGAGFDERARYSETLIAAIRVGAGTPTALCTAFQGGLKRMKRRILHIMNTHSKRIGAAVIALTLALVVLTGSLFSFSAAGTPAALPPFPDDYDRETEELVTFSTPYLAYAVDAYTPAYNYSDDPSYPAAMYAPGTAFEITGHKWRAEHIPGVTGEGGMVWLQANTLDGEALTSIWVPETLVVIGESAGPSGELPHGTLKAAEGQTYISLYKRITDKAPASTFESGNDVTLISWQPGGAQVRQGSTVGYIADDQLALDSEITARLHPAWVDGFDSWHLGYGDYYQQYLSWFGEMEDRYGSYDFWSNELKAVDTQVQRDYGLLQAGDVAYALPEAGDLTAEEAIARGKALIGDDGGVDELGIPYYAWQAYFMYHADVDPEPYWMLRAWATHTDMDRQNIRLSRTGELLETVPFRDDKHPDGPYYSIALMVLYGEKEEFWPAAVRTAYDPEGCPPLREGWATEETVRAVAMDAIEAAFGAEKREKVEKVFTVYASYYNYGRYDESDTEDRIFWTVRCINMATDDREQITVTVNMDGTLRDEPIDDYYGSVDFTPGGNG